MSKTIKQGQSSKKGVQSRKYDKNFISQVVKEVESGAKRKEVCDRYGILPGALKYWMLKQSNGSGHKRRSYAADFKATVAHAVISGSMSLEQARQTYKIQSINTIRGWIVGVNAKNGDLSAINALIVAKKRNNPTTSKENNTSESEQVKVLKKALEDAQLRVLALNTLIDVAEEELNINIRKKPGAKQS